jgi:hypothetical protein
MQKLGISLWITERGGYDGIWKSRLLVRYSYMGLHSLCLLYLELLIDAEILSEVRGEVIC